MRVLFTVFFAIAGVVGFTASAEAQYCNPYYNPYCAQQAAIQQEMVRQEMIRRELIRQEMIRRAAEQAAMQRAAAEENDAAIAGAIELQTHGWGRISNRVNGVIAQLEQWSGQSFTVRPSGPGSRRRRDRLRRVERDAVGCRTGVPARPRVGARGAGAPA